jgi:glycosyltransferase involved in cell wall biosynthesis
MITGYTDRCGLHIGKGMTQKLSVDGINVIVCNIRFGNKQSFPKRIVSFLSFIFLSIYAGLMVKRVDIVYATSTPLTIGIPAMALKLLKGLPFVFEVRDPWPESLIKMGIIKNRIVKEVLLWLERTIYKQSAAIVALCPGMADGVRRKCVDQKTVAMIPNSADLNIFNPDTDGSAIQKERGWTDKFVLLYAGAIGMANGLDFIVDVAEKLKEWDDIHFVLVGDGSRKINIIEAANKAGLSNIEFLDPVPKTEVAKIMAASSASMVILANYPVLEHNSSNKFFDSLSAGKPALLNFSGWQRDILEENHAGFGCKQWDMDEFMEKVLYLKSHRSELAEMGRNARRVAEEMFDRDRLARQALQVITDVCEKQ